MLSNWYKRQRARKEAPQLAFWVLLGPIVLVASILALRWAFAHAPVFLTDDQASLIAAACVVTALMAVVYGGYCGYRLVCLARDAQLTAWEMLKAEEKSD